MTPGRWGKGSPAKGWSCGRGPVLGPSPAVWRPQPAGAALSISRLWGRSVTPFLFVNTARSKPHQRPTHCWGASRSGERRGVASESWAEWASFSDPVGPLGDTPSLDRLVNTLPPAGHFPSHWRGAGRLPSVVVPPHPSPHTTQSRLSRLLLPPSAPAGSLWLAVLITLILKIHKVRSGSFLSHQFSLHSHPFSILSAEKRRPELLPPLARFALSLLPHPLSGHLFQSGHSREWRALGKTGRAHPSPLQRLGINK